MRESIFTIEADQWNEHGFIFREMQVVAYETDRKEQKHVEFNQVSAEAFIANETNAADVRDWARQCIDGRS